MAPSALDSWPAVRAGDSPVDRVAFEWQVEAMRARRREPGEPPIKQLLVDEVLAAWVALRAAELELAGGMLRRQAAPVVEVTKTHSVTDKG